MGESPCGMGRALTVANAIEHYLAFRRPGLAPPTIKNYRIVLTDLWRFLGPALLVNRLNAKHIVSWLEHRPLAATSTRVNLSIVKGFTAWCVSEHHLKHDPCARLRPPRQPEAMPRELESSAVTKTLLSAPDERAALVVSLMACEGLRRAEVARLEVTDVDQTGRLLLVTGKNSKQRWLPITDETYEALEEYLHRYPASSGPLIRSYVHPNRGVTANYIGVLVAGWMRDAGVKHSPRDGRSAHALRHTFAGVMLDDGADVRDVQEALGHSNLGATYIYLRRRRAAGRLRDVMGTRQYR